jgi:hypothetical protein
VLALLRATESAYASDWADFAAWCNSAERLALPADPVTDRGAYLSDRQQRALRNLACAVGPAGGD